MGVLVPIALVTLPSILVLIGLLEIVCRTLIPAAEQPYYVFEPDRQLLHYSIRHQRNGLYTMGPFAEERANWHINNDGWNSPIDYQRDHIKPRLVIIGDSYIEAFQVNADQSLAGQLRQLLPQIEVYSVGISGAPLSQYLHMARYAMKHFHPSALLINIVHNDFDESLCAVKAPVGMLCLDVNGDTVREQTITAYQPNQWMRLLRKSALMRWLVLNLRITSVRLPGRAYQSNVNMQAVDGQRANITTATKYVLRTLAKESMVPVLLMVDAPRQHVYAGTLSTNPVRWMTELVKKEARLLKLPVVDLAEAFTVQYELDGQRFESQYDGHWNAHGHAIAAKAMLPVLRSVVR
jgi:hypothetical protein